MTVYVDNAYIEAEVPYQGRVIKSKWCHLTADSEQELHHFARKLGLKRSWFQHEGKPGFHYDITSRKRKRAVDLGAVEITWREFGAMIYEKAGKEDDTQAET